MALATATKMSLARQVLETAVLWSMFAFLAAIIWIFVSYYKGKPLVKQTLIDLVGTIVYYSRYNTMAQHGLKMLHCHPRFTPTSP